MKTKQDTYKLHNGVEIPAIGYGTWQVDNDLSGVASIKDALTAGYRHIDTAAAYDNEKSVGIAVRTSELDRKDIFVTSKLQNSEHGYQETLAAFEKSMKRLGLAYLDLYLIHWPNPVKSRHNWQSANAGTWKAFEELYLAGRIRSIGVSNFRQHHLEALFASARIMPMVNQIRLCPGDTQDETVEFSRKHGMVLEAYSPLGLGRVVEIPELQEIAESHHKSVAQVSLRWSLQREFLPLPKSTSPVRIRENIDLYDFELSAAEMIRINNLRDCCGLSVDPDTITF